MSLKMRGDKKLLRQFRRMRDETQRTILAMSVREGAELVVSKAKADAPSRPGGGRLKKSIIRTTVRSTRTQVIEHIGYRKGVFYGRFQELGTKRHAAQPSLGPAVKDQRAKIVRRIADVFFAGIKRAVRT